MPKRKAEDKIRRYEEKIKKLKGEQKVQRRRIRVISDSESDIENQGKLKFCIVTMVRNLNTHTMYGVLLSTWR